MEYRTLFATMMIILIVFTASCGSDNNVRYITGQVITAPTQPENQQNIIQNNTLINPPSTITQPPAVITPPPQNNPVDSAIKTYFDGEEPEIASTQEEKLLNSKKCDTETIIPGYHSCYRLDSGNVVVTLKNQGSEPWTGLWFNIEINGKDNYESVSQEMRFLQYGEFILPLNKWQDKYSSVKRIIIMPEIHTEQGNKACPNRGLLLEPALSCWALQ